MLSFIVFYGQKHFFESERQHNQDLFTHIQMDKRDIKQSLYSQLHQEDSLIDEDVIHNLRLLLNDNFEHMIDVYLDTVQRLLSDIERAIINKAPEKLYLASHDLRSYSTHLGIAKLSDIASKLEKLGKDVSQNEAERLHYNAQQAYKEVQVYLKAMASI